VPELTIQQIQHYYLRQDRSKKPHNGPQVPSNSDIYDEGLCVSDVRGLLDCVQMHGLVQCVKNLCWRVSVHVELVLRKHRLCLRQIDCSRVLH
jgi:hypothetical protein